MEFSVFFLLSLALLGITTAQSVENLEVECFSNGTYRISLDGKLWFRSGPLGVRDQGQWWATDENTLALVDFQKKEGQDVAGSFASYQYTWKAQSDKNTTKATLEVLTMVNVFKDIPVVLFEAIFLSGASNTSIANVTDRSISSWPSFVVEETGVERGFLTWSGSMAAVLKYGKWSPSNSIYGDIDGGFPLVVYDSQMENTVVLSPANLFMSASQNTFKDDKTGESVLTFGPISMVDKVPAGLDFQTLLVAGQNVTGTMQKFGEVLRQRFGKKEIARTEDYSINYLGYWTDNGACYYYDSGTYSNYEELLVAVKEDADKKQIPYRYLQIDSWWYYKGKDNGVKNWTATPNVFPNGIQAVTNRTGWPIVAHNRWWSPETDYAKQNGGKYDFLVDSGGAVPVDASFWDFLLSSSKEQWNLLVYEQDWLYVQVGKVPQLISDVELGPMWLEQMGIAAESYGLTIQYCMPWTRHLLQSVAVQAVTQTRASDDYAPSSSQWMIGVTTILAEALGLAAFKDNFHTTEFESGCHSKGAEVAPALHTYVASLSAGPVGPSDHIGDADRTLIMATCMSDGRLLKPTRPAMSIDSSFLQMAFGSGGPDGELWAAFSEVNWLTWYYIIAGQLNSDYSLSASELPPSHFTHPRTSFPSSVAFQYTLDGKITKYQTLDSSSTLTVSKCSTTNFQYWGVAPILEMSDGWAILGELEKVVTFSETRFVSIYTGGSGTYGVSMVGVPGEVVYVTLFKAPTALTAKCVISASGTAQLDVPSGQCG